jgi:hypothetical protein
VQDRLIRAYLWFLVVALPMDWFGPTGAVLREAGAKPAIPLMLAASLVLIVARYRTIVRSLPVSTWRLVYRFLGIFACGLAAMSLNLILGWSQFGRTKDPVAQFIGQGAMFALTPLIIVLHAELLKDRRWSAYLISVLPWAVVIHLVALALDVSGVLRYDRFPLSLFRTGSELVSMRVSGLFSEPSYFATMGAIYGVALLFASPAESKRRNTVLALVLFAAALYTGGKTLVPVAICGFLGYSWYSKARIVTLRNVLAALVICSITVVIVISQSALNVQDNLSSAMRFGSTLTSLNVALSGYGITGVGFGQFHFMFLQKFMPTFLLFSQEALAQMASTADHRTSTYNLFSRYLVETGVLGLGLFLACLQDLATLARHDRDEASLLGILLLSTSLGFLMTQEPYCYPPLMLGASLILSAHNRRVSLLSPGVTK